MKTIKDLKLKNIEKIISILLGKSIDGGIRTEWTSEHDFVIAIFKSEDCVVSDNYDTIDYGIQINDRMEIDHVWDWKRNGSISVEHRPLHNHHAITKYLMDEGFQLIY